MIVTGSYKTESGNIGTFRFDVDTECHKEAFAIAEQRIKTDKRRRYLGSLELSA